MKKITFGSKPSPRTGQGSPDDWVADRSAQPTEPTKRLTIDVPLSLHQRVKSQCAMQGEKMADVIRELLEQRFQQDQPVRPDPIPEASPPSVNTTL